MEIYALLPKILNMSLTASVTILVVLLARLLLARAPKIFRYVLWSVVLFRLLCPITIASSVSLLRMFDTAVTETGSMEYIPSNIAYADWEEVPLPAGGDKAEGTAEQTEPPQSPRKTSAGSVKLHVVIATYVWMSGMTLMLVYSGISLFRLRRRLVGAVCIRNRIYEADDVASPFVIGILQPRIYLPSALSEKERDYILLHERTHIRRGDHIVKLLFFLALVVHWFNPLVWLAFRLMEKDMEMSCDEAVMKHMDGDIRAEYSRSLLGLATGKKIIAGTPLAFGEGDTRARIKNVMRYHKPAIVVVVLAVVIVIVLVLALGSNPRNSSTAAGGTMELKNPGTVAGDTEAQQELKRQMEELEKQQAALQQEEERLQEESKQQQKQHQLAENWAKAFCARDGARIVSMSSETLQNSLQEKELLVVGDDYSSFGWSSPWPWDAENDYTVVRVTETSAEILFYAWVSDPHVTVWREKLTFHMEDGEGLVDTAKLEELDYICAGDTYGRAYPNGITGTRMDYLTNGAGEALNQNAVSNRDSKFYAKLFEPESAAVYLLNLLDNPNKVEVTAGSAKEDGSVPVTIHFMEDDGYVTVYMIQPYGEEGIWIPHRSPSQTDAADRETTPADTLNGIYEISVCSVTESGIDSYVVDEPNGGPDISPIPFASDCIFKVNRSMSGIDMEEVSYDTFAGYIDQGLEAMNHPCWLTMEAGEITEICLKSAYYRYPGQQQR